MSTSKKEIRASVIIAGSLDTLPATAGVLGIGKQVSVMWKEKVEKVKKVEKVGKVGKETKEKRVARAMGHQEEEKGARVTKETKVGKATKKLVMLSTPVGTTRSTPVSC